MATKEINDFTAQDPLLSTDEFLLQQTGGGTTKKVVTSIMQTYMQNNLNFAAVSSSTQSGNYTILDGDGFTHIYLSGAASNSTFTLPTLADNQNRIITLVNLDSTYELNIDGEGAETINGMTDIDLPEQYDYLTLLGTGSTWLIADENITSQLVLNTYAGFGSTDNKIMQFTNSVVDTGNLFTHNHGSYGTAGLEVTIQKAGKYAVSFSKTVGGAADYFGISVNSSQLTTVYQSITVADMRHVSRINAADSDSNNVAVTEYFNVGDIIRPHTGGTAPANTTLNFFNIAYVG